MPTNSKTPIASFGDTAPMPDTGPVPAGFGATPATGFGAPASAPAGLGGFGAVSPGAQGPSSYSPQQPVNTSHAPVMTQAGSNAAEGAEVLLKTDDKFGNFVNSKWRPLMAFIYMITCTCDFVVFPVLWSVLQALTNGNVTSQWQPLTLQGAGLYHLAMGAVLGVAAYGRTKEKVAGAA
jgi:hypothetical protein